MSSPNIATETLDIPVHLDCVLKDPTKQSFTYHAVQLSYQRGQETRALPLVLQAVVREGPHLVPKGQLDDDKLHITVDFYRYDSMITSAHIYVSPTYDYLGETFFKPRDQTAKTWQVPIPDVISKIVPQQTAAGLASKASGAGALAAPGLGVQLAGVLVNGVMNVK